MGRNTRVRGSRKREPKKKIAKIFPSFLGETQEKEKDSDHGSKSPAKIEKDPIWYQKREYRELSFVGDRAEGWEKEGRGGASKASLTASFGNGGLWFVWGEW